MRLGSVNLQLISDGIYWADGGCLFGLVPKVLWGKVAMPDGRNRLPFLMRCLLIETSEQHILVGTGCGDKLTEERRQSISLVGERRLLGNLSKLGISPIDIDLVINTHLHNDHCGGNTCYDESGALVPTFPNATYYVQRLELADATFPNERTRATYLRDDFEPLQRTGQLQTVWGDARLADEVRVIVAPGHTHAHQCVIVESEGQKALFLGDAAFWPVHIERLSWIPAYDVEPLISIETKRSLARWAVENHALLVFEHHPHVQAGYLHPTQRRDRFRLEPADMTGDT